MHYSCDLMENSYNMPNLEQNPTMQVHRPLREQLSRVRILCNPFVCACTHTHTPHTTVTYDITPTFIPESAGG